MNERPDMTAATVTLPTPVVTTPRALYADEVGRTRKARYLITEPTTEATGYAVVLTVSHNKRRKAFSAYLQPVTLGKVESGPFTTESFMVFSGAAVGTEAVARFNGKALDAFTAKMIEKVAALVEVNAEVAALFTDPSSVDRMFGRE